MDDHGLHRVGVATVGGRPTLVAEADGRVTSIAAALGDSPAPSSMIELIERWEDVAPFLPADAGELDPATLDWEPPVMPRKLLCVGANYTDHVAEMERVGAAPAKRTTFPFSFLKPPTTALVGSGRTVRLPTFGRDLDWEAELGVVIGRPDLALSDPLAAVFGYTIVNDLSLRDFVAPFPHPLGLDALISKGFDGASPMGPWITLAGRVGDPQDLAIELRVNGSIKQESSTRKMIFSVAELVTYYAGVLTLEVGDVIATGTPAGVGAGRQPAEYLVAGDEIEIEIERLGCLRTTIGPLAAPGRTLDIHAAISP